MGVGLMSKHFVSPKFVFSLFFCLTVLLACTSPVWAQSATTGGLTGVVTDPSGGVISGATVTLTSTTTGQSRTATTDASGNYKFSLIPPGTYSLKFEAPGFKTSTVSSVTVSITETAVLSQKLEIGAQTSEVTVEVDRRDHTDAERYRRKPGRIANGHHACRSARATIRILSTFRPASSSTSPAPLRSAMARKTSTSTEMALTKTTT